jgi:alkanesulfonate monooxygenase SsuD/methylene tetrahydromethanopterin reductase-like flavin-dependent oxidoreductase (luciferase family)
MTVEFGLSLSAGPAKGKPVRHWLDDLDVCLPQLERYFKSLWMTDHFFWDDEPTYEAWTVLAYLAARWPHFQIGPIVLGQSYRNPALLAKMVATLQALSSGRFIMGIGAGWKEDEYHAYNFPYPRPGIRIEQLEDTLEILKRLWTAPGKVTYRGKHYQIIDAYCEPKPDPVPPIVVGGAGDKTIRLAARYADWWNVPDHNFARYADRVEVVKATCAEVGRDLSTLRLTWFGRLIVAKTEAEALARGQGHWTRDNALVGTPAQVVEAMQQFVGIGVSYFMAEVVGLPDPDVMGLVLEDVLPKVK